MLVHQRLTIVELISLGARRREIEIAKREGFAFVGSQVLVHNGWHKGYSLWSMGYAELHLDEHLAKIGK